MKGRKVYKKRYKRVRICICLLLILAFLGVTSNSWLMSDLYADEINVESVEGNSLIGDVSEGEIEGIEGITDPVQPPDENLAGNAEDQTEETEESEANIYDAQPTSQEEIELLIADYKEKLEEASSEEEAFVSKVHWEYAVEESIMADGYDCILVSDDEEFGRQYYTFAEEEDIFDTQPTSLEEVQKIVQQYQDEVLKVLSERGAEEAKNVRKPHWKYAVKNSFIPYGYTCEAVTNDQDFAFSYYTFFVKPELRAGTWNGSGTEADPYQIATPQQLKELSDDVAAGEKYTGQYFVVMADLDLSGFSQWVPIGNTPARLSIDHDPSIDSGAATSLSPIYGHTGAGNNIKNPNPFEGNFDGQGHTISNITVLKTSNTDDTADFLGLFGVVNGSTLKNIIIDNANIEGASALGALAGYTHGSVLIENCIVKNSKVASRRNGTRLAVGGMIGEVDFFDEQHVNITGCRVEDTEVYSSASAGCTGGMIGRFRIMRDPVTAANQSPPVTNTSAAMTDCHVSGGSVLSVRMRAGGLVGSVENKAASGTQWKFEGCTADISVETQGPATDYYVGGLIGMIWIYDRSDEVRFRVTNCHGYGDVTTNSGTGYYVGGLIGFFENFDHADNYGRNNDLVVEESSAHGLITSGSYYTGGLIGHLHNDITVRKCFASGDVRGKSYNTGGLIGYIYGYRSTAAEKGKCRVEESYATGNVTGTTALGGLIGFADNTDIVNCYALGSIEGSGGALVGTLFGYNNSPFEVKNSYAAGTVQNSGNGLIGNLAGAADDQAIFSGLYYDSTTTGKTVGAPAGVPVTALKTGKNRDVSPHVPGMINAESYDASWNIKDNTNGRANGAGTDENPWYIDEDITYPYFYYQYDGYSKEEVDYNLGSAKYSLTDGSATNKHIGKSRADFTIPIAGTNKGIFYNVKTAGAQKVYYPYLFNHFAFNGAKEIRVPGSGNGIIASPTTPYSLGGMSETDIVSFDPLPYAEKTSDREEYQSGVETTYTKRGDLIEYKVVVINPNIRYDWLDVSFTDNLPEGVTLVEGLYNDKEYNITVKVNDEEAVEVPKDTADPNIGPYYYEYTKATTAGGTDSALTMFLGDFPLAEELEDGTFRMHTMEITFTTLVDRRAVSLFPLNTPQNIAANGDNIRNTGILDGTLQEREDPSNTWQYDTDFDDENVDPVYDSYKVTYIGNGGTTAEGEDEYNEYFLYDKTFKAYDNQGTPFKYEKAGHVFLEEWYSRPVYVEGSTDVYEIGTSYGLISNKNPIAAGNRETADEQDDVLNDYYALTDFKLYAPWKPLTGSIKIIKMGENDEFLSDARFLLERKGEDDTWQAIKWDESTKAWIPLPSDEKHTGVTGENGELIFGKNGEDNTLPFGNYRITEVKSPSGHYLLKDPIEVELPFRKVSDTDPNDGYDSHYTDAETGDTVYEYYNLTYTVTNVAEFDMPEAGNKAMGLPWYLYAGILMIMVSSGTTIRVHQVQAKKRKEAFNRRMQQIKDLMNQSF